MDVVANSSYHAQAHPGLVTKESVSGFKVESSLRWLKIQIFPQIALAIGFLLPIGGGGEYAGTGEI